MGTFLLIICLVIFYYMASKLPDKKRSEGSFDWNYFGDVVIDWIQNAAGVCFMIIVIYGAYDCFIK